MKNNSLQPKDIAAYFLRRANDDGDLISPLKMQKLVYYAYSWVYTLNGKVKLFDEAIEAWPNGPVAPTLYRALSGYGSSPIDEKFLKTADVKEDLGLSDEIMKTLNDVYQTYMPMSAFELVTLTHNESPWVNARKGLSPTTSSKNKLADTDIYSYFSSL